MDFSLCAFLTVVAMINFAATPQDLPVTRGMYRFMRHPIQVLANIMWIGVGIATTSWIILLACLALVMVSYPSFLAQERSCLELYGDTYRKYMEVTPRYILFGVKKQSSQTEEVV